MFKFRAKKLKSCKPKEVLTKRYEVLKKSGITILAKEVEPLICNQILEDKNEPNREMLKRIGDLVGLPITIIGFATEEVTREIKKFQKDCTVYMYQMENKPPKILYISENDQKFEIGTSNKEKTYTTITQDGTKTITRIIDDGYQCEKIDTIRGNIYVWQYNSDTKKVIISISGNCNEDIKYYEKLSELMKNAIGNLWKIIVLLKKYTKLKNSQPVTAKIKYEEDTEKKSIKIESGNLMQYDINNEEYVFNWTNESFERFVLSSNKILLEEDRIHKFKYKYNIKLSYNKQIGKYGLEIIAFIKTKDSNEDTLGIWELILLAEKKIQSYLLLEEDAKDVIFTKKTSHYSIDYHKGDRYIISSKENPDNKYNITYSNSTGWKVVNTRIIPEGNTIKDKGVQELIELSKTLKENIRK